MEEISWSRCTISSNQIHSTIFQAANDFSSAKRRAAIFLVQQKHISTYNECIILFAVHQRECFPFTDDIPTSCYNFTCSCVPVRFLVISLIYSERLRSTAIVSDTKKSNQCCKRIFQRIVFGVVWWFRGLKHSRFLSLFRNRNNRYTFKFRDTFAKNSRFQRYTSC